MSGASIEDVFRDAFRREQSEEEELHEDEAKERAKRGAEASAELVALQEFKRSQFFPYMYEFVKANKESVMMMVTESNNELALARSSGALKMVILLERFLSREEQLLSEIKQAQDETKR